MAILTNAVNYLTTPTHEGSGQVVHPSVIDFLLEHGMPTWAEYRYWMAITPYPGGNDAHEDPNILASNDGLKWVVPNGMVNPLDDATGGLSEGGYNNDPELVYNPDTNELWVYYCYAHSSVLEERLVKVSPDMSYTPPQTIISITPWTQVDNKKRSPAIWRESANRWHMWGGGGTLNPPYNIYYSFSEDGIGWSEPQQCLNSDGNDPFQALVSGMYNWHMSVKPNYRENRIEFFSYTNGTGEGIYYAQCDMNNPTVINTPIATPILSGAVGKWDAKLYRASFVIGNDNNSYRYHIWYTARNNNEWHLGYTSGSIGTGFIGKGWW